MKIQIHHKIVMEGAACRLLVPLTLLVLVPLVAAIAADEEVGHADVGGINQKHKTGTTKSNATPTAIAADEEVGHADVGGINQKHKTGTTKSNATPTATAADEDVGYADVVGNKYKQESERKKGTHIADFDPVWQKRAQEAQKAAFEAYNPNPETVTNSLNKKVKGSFENPTLVKQANEIKKEENKEGQNVEGKKDNHDQVKKGEEKEKHEGKGEEEEHEGKKKEKN